MRRLFVPAGALLAALAACHSPAPAPAPAPAAQAPQQPQFTYGSWTTVSRLVREGKVIQTVSGHNGFSVILTDHTWVHLVAKPGDPLPKNPREYVYRHAPNAAMIRHTNE
jgi:hypothetical protein